MRKVISWIRNLDFDQIKYQILFDHNLQFSRVSYEGLVHLHLASKRKIFFAAYFVSITKSCLLVRIPRVFTTSRTYCEQKQSGEIIDKWMSTFHRSGRAPKLCNKICYSSFPTLSCLWSRLSKSNLSTGRKLKLAVYGILP